MNTKGVLLFAFLFSVLLSSTTVCFSSDSFSYVSLYLNDDQRDEDMVQFDDLFDQKAVQWINDSGKLKGPVVWKRQSLLTVVKEPFPVFCKLHFDAVKSSTFTEDEKAVLIEYFSRGGFIEFVEDDYPYDETDNKDYEFQQKAKSKNPILIFLTKDLPKVGKDFKFKVYKPTAEGTPDFYKIPTYKNKYTPPSEFLLMSNRYVGCVTYVGADQNKTTGRWTPLDRPFKEQVSMYYNIFYGEVSVFINAFLN
jgi:hypothetical protein